MTVPMILEKPRLMLVGLLLLRQMLRQLLSLRWRGLLRPSHSNNRHHLMSRPGLPHHSQRHRQHSQRCLQCS